MYHNIDIHEYIKSLPINRVKEIHINGSSFDEDGYPMDTHKAMDGEDYELLEFALSICKPQIITLEYNGIDGETEEQISKNIIYQIKIINKMINN